MFAWLRRRGSASEPAPPGARLASTSLEALRGQADALLHAGEIDPAVTIYRQVVAGQPDDARALTSLGFALMQLQAHDEAAAHLQRAAELDPTSHDAPYLLGTICEGRGETGAAIGHFAIAAGRAPAFVAATLDWSRLLASSGRLAEARQALQTGIAHHPGLADLHFFLGNLSVLEGRPGEAAACYEAAIGHDPAHLAACLALGNLHVEAGRIAEAAAAFQAALAIDPANQVAGTNLGNALMMLGRPAEAFDVLSRSAQLHADVAALQNNLGNALVELGRAAEAIPRYERAVAIQPGFVEALVNMGNALSTLKLPREAIAAFERARAIDGDAPWLAGSLMHTRLSICEWQGIDAAFADLARRIDLGQPAAVPFAALAAPLSSSQQQTCAGAYVKASAYPQGTVPARRPRGERIRLGYFSADFHGHATAYLMAELFERHDRERFEVIAFSYGPSSQHPMRRRLLQAFDRFVEVEARSDAEICDLARAMEIDIAIDLKGYTQDARTAIFARRAAPIQVNFIGYPGTMGAPFIDYVIGDRVVLPQELVANFTEQVVWLPHSYQVNDRRREVADVAFTRREVGLPDKGFVFCCFNNSYKITPDVFAVWMRLLSSVSGSVLWLLEDSALAAANLRAEAAARGVDAGRLVFAPRLGMPEHLARQRLAGLFLDTLYCNAHTTASDALWVGLPVLTCPGHTFASRVAASLLHAAGLPELAVDSVAAYEQEAFALATQPGRLEALRQRLEGSRLSSPLFDAGLFARHLEVGYASMHERHLAGLPPQFIDISASLR